MIATLPSSPCIVAFHIVGPLRGKSPRLLFELMYSAIGRHFSGCRLANASKSLTREKTAFSLCVTMLFKILRCPFQIYSLSWIMSANMTAFSPPHRTKISVCKTLFQAPQWKRCWRLAVSFEGDAALILWCPDVPPYLLLFSAIPLASLQVFNAQPSCFMAWTNRVIEACLWGTRSTSVSGIQD